MSLKPSKLRRLNQRVTLAGHKIRRSVTKPFLSLLVVLTTNATVQEYSLRLTNIVNKRKRFYFFQTPFSESEILLLNRLGVCTLLLHSLETVLEVMLVIRIFKVIFESYSNSKY